MGSGNRYFLAGTGSERESAGPRAPLYTDQRRQSRVFIHTARAVQRSGAAVSAGSDGAREGAGVRGNPDTLTSVNNLAFLYEEQGRYEEAEPLYQRALVE
ncbi:MAG: tetratricopeptide repeat protein [Candidatus Competibacteraceae bacterium]